MKRFFQLCVGLGLTLFMSAVLTVSAQNIATLPQPGVYQMTAQGTAVYQCDNEGVSLGMLLAGDLVEVTGSHKEADASITVQHNGTKGVPGGCSFFSDASGLKTMTLVAPLATATAMPTNTALPTSTPQTVAQVATATPAIQVPQVTQVNPVATRVLPTATATALPREFQAQISLNPASRLAFPDKEPALVVYGSESAPQPGKFDFTLGHNQYQVVAGGPQAASALGIDCKSNCLVVILNQGAEATFSMNVGGTPFALKGDVAADADPQDAIQALAEWYSQVLAVNNNGLSAEVHVLRVNATTPASHWSGTYVPADNPMLTLVDVLAGPTFVAQTVPTQVIVNWETAQIALPGAYTSLDDRLRNDWLLYQPADPQCAVQNNTEESCTTREQQASFGPVTLEPNEMIRASGDGVEFYQRGFTSPLVESPTSRRNLWFVVNAGSKKVALDFSGPFGSDRGYFTLATGNTTLTPEMVEHSVSLGVKQFLDPQQTASLSQIDPVGTPLPFTPTPAPNCGQPLLGCANTDIVVVIFTDAGTYVLMYGWYDQNENGGMYHAMPAPKLNWRAN